MNKKLKLSKNKEHTYLCSESSNQALISRGEATISYTIEGKDQKLDYTPMTPQHPGPVELKRRKNPVLFGQTSEIIGVCDNSASNK